MLPGIPVQEHPHPVAVPVSRQVSIGEVLRKHLGGQGVGPKEVDGLPSQELHAVIGASVCQHLHQPGVIAAVGDDPGEARNGSQGPHEFRLPLRLRQEEWILVPQLLPPFQIIVLHQAALQVSEEEVGRAVHAQGLEEHFPDDQLRRLPAEGLQKPCRQLAGEAVEEAGSGLKGQRDPGSGPDLVTEGEVSLLPELLHLPGHGQGRGMMLDGDAAYDHLIGQPAGHIEDMLHQDGALRGDHLQGAVRHGDQLGGIAVFREIFIEGICHQKLPLFIEHHGRGVHGDLGQGGLAEHMFGLQPDAVFLIGPSEIILVENLPFSGDDAARVGQPIVHIFLKQSV